MATTKSYTQCTSYEYGSTHKNPVHINSTHRFHTSRGGSHNHTGLTPTVNVSQHQSTPNTAGWLTVCLPRSDTPWPPIETWWSKSDRRTQRRRAVRVTACWRESPPIDPEHMLTTCTLTWKNSMQTTPTPGWPLKNVLTGRARSGASQTVSWPLGGLSMCT